MIPRYSRPDMRAIWEPANRFHIWFKIEAHACDALADLGVVPSDAAAIVWKRGDIPYTEKRIARIEEIELETHHDVIAFLTELAEQVGEPSRFVHQGMTSSDMLDTCLAVQLKEAADILLADLDGLMESLKKRAYEFKLTPCIGRSHGIHAEPTTFGVKLAGHYAEFKRCRTRLESARADIATCNISGAVGTFANVDPKVESYVAKHLGLTPEPVSTQVIPRDRHAMFFAVLGIIATAIERLSVEIRHLQRTEVREAQEYFAHGQKGSSSMPHKRNPVLTENLTGLARIVRSTVIPAMENMVLWHERDISHSSVERVIAPDATITLDFAITRMTSIIKNLVVYSKNMEENLNKFGGIHDSQRILLMLTQKGATRENAYKIVQRAAMKVWRSFGVDPDNPDITVEPNAEDLEAAKQDNRLLYYLVHDKTLKGILTNDDCQELLDTDPVIYHTKHVKTIFQRVFGKN